MRYGSKGWIVGSMLGLSTISYIVGIAVATNEIPKTIIEKSQIRTPNAILSVDLTGSFAKELAEIKQLIKSTRTTCKTTVTAYHPASGGINSDQTPDKTSTMTKPIAGWTAAISTELVELGWLGQKIYLDGYGVFKATDRMAKGLTGKRVDVCVGSQTTAIKYGKKTGVLTVRLMED